MSPLLMHRNNLAHFARQTPHHSRPASGESGTLRRWASAAWRRWKRRKMINVLQSLDDHLLRDIGLARAEIHKVVQAFDDRELGMVPIAPPRSIHSAMDHGTDFPRHAESDIWRQAA